jgi:hypothetical protein
LINQLRICQSAASRASQRGERIADENNFKLRNMEGELSEPATIKEYLIVRQEGKRQVRRSVKHYTNRYMRQ